MPPVVNESQTECYRMLGLETMDQISRSLEGVTLDHVRRAAEEYVKSPVEAAFTEKV